PRRQLMRRLLATLEVGLERVHPRGREQDRRIVLGRHQGAGGQALVVAALEEAQEAIADLVGGHAGESRLRGVRVTSTRIVYENRWMRVREDITELPDGSPGLYGWIDKRPSAMIIALDGEGV